MIFKFKTLKHLKLKSFLLLNVCFGKSVLNVKIFNTTLFTVKLVTKMSLFAALAIIYLSCIIILIVQ